MSLHRLRIATRNSRLALWQAEHVATRLRAIHEGLRVELVSMTTEGDQMLEAPLALVGGKGLFVKALETALLEHKADIAVHSMKDVPVRCPAGLGFTATLTRGDPHDALISPRYESLSQLPAGATVGTSSLRRKCQLAILRPDLRLVNLRGNLDTRLRKLDGGEFDAIVLAVAGLERMAMGDRIRERLGADQMLPAIGQGTLGIQCRVADTATAALLAPLHDEDSARDLIAEREMNAGLDGGCQLPVAGFAELVDPQTLRCRGLVASLDGRVVLREERRGEPQHAAEIGSEVAGALLNAGAGRILAEVYGRA